MEATTEEVKPRLSREDIVALRALGPEDQKLLKRLKDAFEAYVKRMNAWQENPVGESPKLPEVVRFAPYLKKLDGGVRVCLWSGSSKFNPITGEQEVTPSEWLDIYQSGHLPRSFEEAQRLLVLARQPNHKCAITTWDKKEMAPDLKTAELKLAQTQEELAKSQSDLEEAKREIARLKGEGKK